MAALHGHAQKQREAGKPDVKYEKFLKKKEANVRRIERKYKLTDLHDPFNFGLLSGRMSALSWVMGAEWWYESLDT